MFVTKKALPRRVVLRGLGATIALPFLDAMVPALTATAQTAAAPVPRMAFFSVPNGMFLPNFHPKGGGGTDFELTPILQPLAPLRDQMVVLSGLSNLGVESPSEGSGVHTRASGGFLTGVRVKKTEGSDLRSAKTIDQYAADKLGADTSLRSLELTVDSNFQVGNCENGYSCAYVNSNSWLTPTTPLSPGRSFQGAVDLQDAGRAILAVIGQPILRYPVIPVDTPLGANALDVPNPHDHFGPPLEDDVGIPTSLSCP